MARMRDFEAEAEAALGKTWDEISRPFHHRDQAARVRVASQQPATAPGTMRTATAAPETGGTMSLTQIEDDVRADLSDGLAYVAQWASKLQGVMPAIVSTVDKVGGSTVGKLAETLAGAVIPQPYEDMLVGLVGDFAKRYGQPAVQPAAPATAQAAQPQQPAPAAQ